IVSNPALTLTSATFSERDQELEQQINDAQTKFIMGKIDEAGYCATKCAKAAPERCSCSSSTPAARCTPRSG
ncbi:hypothetical protein PV407_18765, partial [Paenibacillus sp. GYB003]